MVFFGFLNYFAIFFQFSIWGQVGNDRNDNFYSNSFSACPNLCWLEKMPKWCFSIFKIFFAIFFLYYLLGVGLEIIGTIIFILTLSRPFPTQFCLARCHNGVFLIFWLFFLEFSIQGRVRNDRNNNFYFNFFSTFPNLFWPEKKPY